MIPLPLPSHHIHHLDVSFSWYTTRTLTGPIQLRRYGGRFYYMSLRRCLQLGEAVTLKSCGSGRLLYGGTTSSPGTGRII